MPELPEVQSVVNHLARVLKSRVFVSAKILAPKSVSSKFEAGIKRKKILNVVRRAKMIVIELSGGKFLVIHLKMTGQLIFVSRKGQAVGGGHPITSPDFDLSQPNKFTRVVLNLNQGGKLLFHDVRKFGWLKIMDQKQLALVDQKHGLEPLSREFTFKKFQEIINRRPKLKIKQLLMLQQLIAGIGNIYADESLFKARILPFRQAGSLRRLEVKELFSAIKSLLKQAVSLGGTSVNTFIHSTGQPGNFVTKLKVYKRGGQKCSRCGQILKKTRLAGRGTVYCSNCQK